MLVTKDIAKRIYSSRKLITKDDASSGKKVILVLQGKGNVIDVVDGTGKLVTDATTGEVLRKSIHNVKNNSEVAVTASPNRSLQSEAIAASNAGEVEKASELFNKYLNKCQLSFSILSNHKLFGKLQDNDTISAKVVLITTENGSILTLDANSIQIMQPEEVTRNSVWGEEEVTAVVKSAEAETVA